MALSLNFMETVKSRAMRDPEFCEALLVEAADLLNVPRPFLDRLLKAGTISSQVICKSRLISMDNVMTYKARVGRQHEPDLENLGETTQAGGRG